MSTGVVKKPPIGYNRHMNWDLIGHEWAVHLLKEHILKENLRHAYLFTGPQGTGRRTLALHLAQALNCPQPIAPGEACGTCSTCTRITRMQYTDLNIVKTEPGRSKLVVDQVRELQHTLALAPYEGHYRIAVLLRFEEANPSAANALLKTLEEPNPQVIIILTANSAENLLPTIVSRCEVLRLGLLPIEVVSTGLQEKYNLPAEKAQFLAHLSNGRPGYAISLHQQPELLEQRRSWLVDLERMNVSNRLERFEYAEILTKDKDKTRFVLQIWVSFWRDVMLCASGYTTPITNTDYINEINRLANIIPLAKAYQIVSALEKCINQLDINVNIRLAIEVLLLDLPYL